MLGFAVVEADGGIGGGGHGGFSGEREERGPAFAWYHGLFVL